MFVLKELDKILQNIGSVGGQTRTRTDDVRISLSDIGPIDIGKLNLAEILNIPHGPPLTIDQMKNDPYRNPLFNRLFFVEGKRYPTTDSLFVSLMNQFIFAKITKLPERHYAPAKLLICDRFSYEMILKHERIISLASNDLRNFLYKQPFNITAIFELDNLLNLIERSGEPLVLMKRHPSTGNMIANYNYNLARKAFPYLKMSDLAVILKEGADLDLSNFPFTGTKEHKVLQYLSHFARSFQLIELGSLTKIIGRPHSIYNNVLIINPNIKWDQYYSRLPLIYLSFMATQLVSLAEKLKLRLETLTYRLDDPHQQTKVFSNFLAATIEKTKHDLLDSRFTKVLVVDRFHDLRGPLMHADRFEAFLRQERSQVKLLKVNDIERPSLDKLDEQLDNKLQLARLTEVLGIILEHALQLKLTTTADNRTKARTPIPIHHSLSKAMTTSKSINRNLEIVKIFYKSLNEGYLIVLKLEASLDSICNEFKTSTKPLTIDQQVSLAERLQRIVSAYRQLAKVSGKTIDSSDMIRLACLITDTINLSLNTINRYELSSKKAIELINKAKFSLMQEKKFGKENISRFDPLSKFKDSDDLFKRLIVFDSISKLNCNHRSSKSIDNILESLLDNKLDDGSGFSTINLVEKPIIASKDVKTTLVLIYLGAISPGELIRIKALERQFTKTHQLCDIIVLTCAIAIPDDFMASL